MFCTSMWVSQGCVTKEVAGSNVIYLVLPNYLPNNIYHLLSRYQQPWYYTIKNFCGRHITLSPCELNLFIAIEIEHRFILPLIWITSYTSFLGSFGNYLLKSFYWVGPFFLIVFLESFMFLSSGYKVFLEFFIFLSFGYNCYLICDISFYLLYSMLMNRSSSC